MINFKYVTEKPLNIESIEKKQSKPKKEKEKSNDYSANDYEII